MDLDSFLIELYVMIDDWWKVQPEAHTPHLGRPPQLSPSEVLTLAVLAQWPHSLRQRGHWRFATAHLRWAFPQLCSQSRLNRRVRSAEPLLWRLHAALARHLTRSAAVYYVLDTTLIPAIHRVRACRHGLLAGEDSFGCCVSKTAWVYGFKVALTVDPQGVITTFELAPANSDERPIGEALIAVERYPGYLADKGYASLDWERHWAEQYENLVAATPPKTADVEQETQRKELGMLSEGDVVCRSQFLNAENPACPAKFLCRLLGVARSVCYTWQRRGVSDEDPDR